METPEDALEAAKGLLEFLVDGRPKFLQSRGNRIATEILKSQERREIPDTGTPGLDREDMVIAGDEDFDSVVPGVVAGFVLAMWILGARPKRRVERLAHPWELDSLHQSFAKRMLRRLRRHPRGTRALILSLEGNGVWAVIGRRLVEEAYLLAMRSLHGEARSASFVICQKPHREFHLVPPGVESCTLDAAHRITFDLLFQMMKSWARGEQMPRIAGQKPTRLYGLVVADLWRSSLAPLGDTLWRSARGDALAYLSLMRPSFSPLTLREILELAGLKFGPRIGS